MLSFLLLVSTTGQPLPHDAVGRLAAPPRGLPAVPSAMTTWRSDDDRVALVAWSDRPAPWHLGRHGVTLATGHPWPLVGRFTAPGGVALELTNRLGDEDEPGLLSWLTGATTVVRVRPDGTGVVAAPPLGGGQVAVARGDGLLAVADRTGVAAAGVGGAPRRSVHPELLTGSLLGEHTGHLGVRRLRPGQHVRLRGPGGAEVVTGAAPWEGLGDATLDDVLDDAVDEVARLVELAAEHPGPERVVELGASPEARVVAAALAAAGRLDRFTLRPAPGHDGAAAVLAGALDARLAGAVHLAGDGEATDTRVRVAVARTEGAVAPHVLLGGALDGPRDVDGLLVPLPASSVLAPATPGAAAPLLRVGAPDRPEGDGSAARVDAVRHELWDRGPRHARAAADLAAGADVLDPLAAPSVARAALVAAREGVDLGQRLVAALHPPLAELRGGAADAAPAAPWRALATVVEAHVAGSASDAVATALDIDEVLRIVRQREMPGPAVVRALEGALALALWADDAGLDRPATRSATAPRVHVQAPTAAPVLVTGITSRSLLELAGTGVPLDDVDVDAMLGVRVDREARDLVHRLLLAAGATPGHLPADLDERLAGPATAALAGPASALLARRGGTLVDPRLATTLPFWAAHVATPRVVLVCERPPDLAARSRARLPTADLLGWWVDAVTTAATAELDVRVVDPGDLLELDQDEATAWEGLDADDATADLVRVARTVDSLVREVELEAARPLLRTIRRARVGDRAPGDDAAAPASVPLRVVDGLWDRAVAADAELAEQRATAEELEQRLAAAESEAEQLRGRRGLKAAWRVLTGG